ncbi:MAG: histidinol-phosphate transaminase [Pseudomonadales bacterium]|nr:histidinol-phosphate transaminase [Pseudomonadales bacterium]
MVQGIETWVAPGVRGLAPYQPGKPISDLERELGIQDIVKLASNENPLGYSPHVRDALSSALPDMARYPDGGGYALKSALARYYGLTQDQVTLGNGSNDVLDIVARTFLTHEQGAIVAQYAFAIYALTVQAMSAPLQVVPAIHYGHDLTAMAQAVQVSTRLIFIANPNNPTGSSVSQQELKVFMQELPPHVHVVLDEAYLEYSDEGGVDAATWIEQFPRLIICRTFSKAYGLAGLRIGYALSSAPVANLLNRVRQPFNVSSLGLVAAEAALADQDFVMRTRQLNQAGLQQLRAPLEGKGLQVLPSQGNFLCLDMGRPAQPVYEALLRQGVIVRPLGGYGMPNHLRVSVGLPEENARFLTALDHVLS